MYRRYIFVLAHRSSGYKVGWRAFTDLDKAPEDEDAKDKRLYNAWIKEQYYGQWYHNAAVIVVVRVHKRLLYSSLYSLSYSPSSPRTFSLASALGGDGSSSSSHSATRITPLPWSESVDRLVTTSSAN